MSKYIVETFYTCSFKIVHKLDELNEKKLSELENRKDGEVQVLEVRLNNSKRSIYVLKNNYLQTFLNDIRDIMTYQKSSSYINEKYIRTEQLNISMS